MFDGIIKNKLIAVDINDDLINVTAQYAEKLLNNDVYKVNVIFPNRRAVRFFERSLNKKAFLRVDAYSMPDFVKYLVYSKSKDNYFYQQELDRYFLILNLIKRKIPKLYKRLGNKEDSVFPWCVRISKLFNEFDKELLDNIKKVEYLDNVVKEAKEIMLQLDVLYKLYRNEMEEKKITFSGDLYRKVNSLDLNKNSGYIFSGFVNLTKGEKSFIKKTIEESNSLIIFQTDLLKRHENFNPYEIYDEWLNGKFWGEKPDKLKVGQESKQSIKFFESFDLHSSCEQFNTQLDKISNLKNEKNPLKTAVVLPDENSLIPVINSLNDGNVNITMGFPFEKSIISQILKNFINLSRTYSEKGYYHKPLLSLLNNKLMRNIEIDKYNFEKLFEKIAKNIQLNGIPFIKFDNLTDLSNDELEKLFIFENKILQPFIKANNLFEIGEVFQNFLIFLENFLKNNEEFKLERQISENFIDSFLFKISEAESSKEIFENKEIIYSILLSIVENISIMFEGNPLTGLQVMGMLEARMLKFENIFIFDVNEGILPPDNKIDPLVPDIIKKEIGIKSYTDNLKLYKYYFFRLIDSCENVFLFFQKGENNEEKKIKSRFIEQLLFEIEYKKISENENLSIKEFENSLIETKSVKISSNLKEELFNNILKNININLKEMTLSASSINDYIACPLRFCFSNVLKIGEEVQIIEAQDPRNVGTIIHEVLEKVLINYKSQILDYKLIKDMEKKVLEMVEQEIEVKLFQLSNIRKRLLKETAIFRLKTYFKNLYEQSKENDIMFLEFEKSFNLIFNGIKFYGVIDRIDYVENKIENFYKVVDYKTGTFAKIPENKINKFLENFDFENFSKDNQLTLFNKLKSIQLPLYNFMLHNSKEYNAQYEEINSSLILLGASPFDSFESQFEGKNLSLEKFEKVLEFILNCMDNIENYYFKDSSDCSFCPHYKSCMVTSHIGKF